MNIKSKFTLCCVAVLLSACSANEPVAPLEEVAGSQTIVLKVSALRSRAGRELLSSETLQAIENVKVVLADDNGEVVWTKLINDWVADDASQPMTSVATADGREAEIEIPKDEFRMMGGAKYYAYSYGFSNGSDYDLKAIIDLKVGDKMSQNVSVPVSKVMGEEIFAGNCEIIGDIKGVRVDLVLNRQVAGTYAYLTKIPYVRDNKGHEGRYLILVASNPKSELVLGNFDNTNDTEYKGLYVANGSVDRTDNVVYSIDLLDWFQKIEPSRDADGRSSGLIRVGDNWIGDAKMYKLGSVYAGRFIIPFEKSDKSSLQLHLCYDNDVNTSMRVWNVLLPVTAKQLNPYDFFTYASGAWSSVKQADTDAVYNILRNHLYAIGVKESAVLPSVNPGDPGDPDDPNTPEDEPEPINNKQDLNVIVNHNWSTIYIMDVE